MIPSHFFIAGALFTTGTFVVGWATSTIRNDNHLRTHGNSTNALILQVVHRRPDNRQNQDYWLTIRFYDRDKRKHTVSFAAPYSRHSFDYLVGGTLPILYDPNTPEIFEETRHVYSRRGHKYVGLGGLLILASAWALWVG